MAKATEKPENEQQKKSDDGALKAISQGSSEHPKAFLSYAWSDPEHKERVRLFADRLIGKGIDVILDVYDNKPGHELNHFMEQSATDNSVTHVLVIADKIYTDKADARTGGVGTETQLISPEVYKKIDQTKVVPLVFERNENGEPCLPAYMKSRHYIDFTDESQFDTNFDELVRHIYNQPIHAKPPLGAIPVFDTTAKHTAEKLPSTKVQPTTGSTQPGFDVASNELLGALKKLRKIGGGDAQIDDKIIAGINTVEPYVNGLLNELDALLEVGEMDDKKLVEKIDKLLTSAKSNQAPLPGVNSWRDADYEHIGFIIHELATAVVALLVKHRRFQTVHNLINRTYFYRTNTGELRTVTFNDFYQYMRTLDDHRNSRLKLNRVSIAADIQKENAAKYDAVNFDDLHNADSLLHLLTRFNFPDNRDAWWFPRLSVYSRRSEGVVDPMGELISKSRADEIAKMFGATDVDKLIAAHKVATEISSKIDYNAGWNFHVPTFSGMLPERIAELP